MDGWKTWSQVEGRGNRVWEVVGDRDVASGESLIDRRMGWGQGSSLRTSRRPGAEEIESGWMKM